MTPVSTAGQAGLGSGEQPSPFLSAHPQVLGCPCSVEQHSPQNCQAAGRDPSLCCKLGTERLLHLQKQPPAPSRCSGSQQPVEGSRRLNPCLGVCTLPSLLPQPGGLFRIPSMFCAGQSRCSSQGESPTSCQAAAGVSRCPCCVQARREHRLWNPIPGQHEASISQSVSDELISFPQHPSGLGLSTASSSSPHPSSFPRSSGELTGMRASSERRSRAPSRCSARTARTARPLPADSSDVPRAAQRAQSPAGTSRGWQGTPRYRCCTGAL